MPEAQFGFGPLGACALPVGVVGVPDRQGGQVGTAVLQGRRVQLAQVPGQHTGGPAVGDDVVQGQDEDVLVGGAPDQADPEQRPGGQVEGGGGLPLQKGVEGAFRTGAHGCEVREVVHRQVHGACRVDRLPGLAVPFGERGAQGLVPGDQPVQGGAQGGGVERAAQAQHGQGRVLGAARLETVEEPQALLGVRQGRGGVRIGGRDGVGGAPVPGLAQLRRQGGQRRVGEQQPGRDVRAEGGAQP